MKGDRYENQLESTNQKQKLLDRVHPCPTPARSGSGFRVRLYA